MPETSGVVLGVAMGFLLLGAQLLGCVLDGLDDVHVPGAAAQVAADRFADLRLAGALVAREQRVPRHQHARRAVAALQPVLLPETFLHGMQLGVLLKAFDRGHLAALGLHREHRARLDRLAVEQHRARPTVRGVEADVRARQAQVFTQEVHEQEPRGNFGGLPRAVHHHVDLVVGHGYLPSARWTAFLRARAASTRAISRLYSTEPRRSALGEHASPASRAASAMAVSEGRLLWRKSCAAWQRMGVGPPLVSASPTLEKASLA